MAGVLMDERTELAQLLGKHFGTSAAGDDYLWVMADILMERGWRKGREEWGVMHHGYGNAHHVEPADDLADAQRKADMSAWSGFVEPSPVRRYVADPTDWEAI